MTTYVFAMLWFEKLRERREALGLSQADLAKKVSVSQAGINKIENGRVIKTKFLPRIAKELGLNLSDLDPDYRDWRTKSDEIEKADAHTGIYKLDYYYASDQIVDWKEGDTNLLLTGDRDDGSMFIFEKPLGRIKRPPHLQNVEGVLAFLIGADRMFPEIKRGDIVFGVIGNDPLGVAPEVGSTCIFVSTKYGLPEASIGRLCRVTAVYDESWNTSQWKPQRNDVSTEILFANEWSFSVIVVAKYYAELASKIPDYDFSERYLKD